jgi:asparagine synthetase B (glutamine-hydrolysing)
LINDASDELLHARIVADWFKTDHKEYIVKFEQLKKHFQIVWYMEEPIRPNAGHYCHIDRASDELSDTKDSSICRHF